MRKYTLNPNAFKGYTRLIDTDAVLDAKLKTNVKGVFIHEYWHPYNSSNCSLMFLQYEINKITQKDRKSYHSFCTLEEAKLFYNKWLKHPNTKTITSPKKRYIHSDLSISWEREIVNYAEKRGVLKSGFDIEIIQEVKA